MKCNDAGIVVAEVFGDFAAVNDVADEWTQGDACEHYQYRKNAQFSERKSGHCFYCVQGGITLFAREWGESNHLAQRSAMLFGKNKSLVCFSPNPRASVRLFCFPCAGGGASMYRRWATLLPDVEVWAVN